ncbi:hypothetical protein AB0F64_12640 [Streptomyces sp. NPDC026294]|uniref:hypothetical protein n=1 Tax=Streptomyces sp. NPDC026294 TaxID=3155362 RepID=UPI0033CDA94F
MRKGRSVAAVVVLAAVVAGCGSSSKAGKGGGQPGEEGAAAAKPLAKLAVPAAYDPAKGWDESLNWVPESVTTLPVTAVPGSDAVAVMQVASSGYTVTARATDSTRVLWRSAPWNPPTPVEGAQGGPGEKAEIPDVTGVEQDGHRYIVAYAHGLRGKDDLHKGTEVVRLALYPAEAGGTAVKPVREIDVPVSASPGKVRVQASGGRLLVAWGEAGAYPSSSAAVDVATGKVIAYKDANQLLPQCAQAIACSSSRVIAATEEGPLVAMGGGGFGIPGRWFSDAVRPKDVDAKTGILGSWNGSVYGADAGNVLVGWHTGGTYGSDDNALWSVHDLRTGALKARLACAQDVANDTRSTRDYAVVTSANGRYLAAGPVAFDLQRKQGICLKGDGNRKTVAVHSIRDDGTAYGVVEDQPADHDTAVIVGLNLKTATGTSKVLGAGTEVPYQTTPRGSGVFVTRDEDKNVRVSVRAGR